MTSPAIVSARDSLSAAFFAVFIMLVACCFPYFFSLCCVSLSYLRSSEFMTASSAHSNAKGIVKANPSTPTPVIRIAMQMKMKVWMIAIAVRVG